MAEHTRFRAGCQRTPFKNAWVLSTELKLLRFELKSEPGEVRSGIVSMGRVYETKDGEAAGMHEAAAVRPLVPIQNARSVRFFRTAADETGEAAYDYGNPGTLVGPSQSLPFPPAVGVLHAEAYLAAVLLGTGYRVEPEIADDLVLGFTLAIATTTRHEDGRRADTGIAIGPVLTTPDELEDFVIGENRGREHSLDVTLRHNSVDARAGRTDELPLTFAQAIASASAYAPVREGDVFLLGPLVDPLPLEPDDEVTLAVEALGALSLKITHEP